MSEDVIINWELISDMPNGPRLGMASAVIGEKIYLIGGTNSKDSFDRIEVYDTINGTWETIIPTLSEYSNAEYSWSQGRYSHTASVLNDEIYIIGGIIHHDSSWESVSYVDIYNPNDNSMRPGPQLSQARHELASAVLQGKIFALGGQDHSGAELDNVEVLRSNGWLDVDQLIIPRSKLDAVSIGGNLYAISGISSPSIEKYEYDPFLDEFIWKIIAPIAFLPTHRFNSSSLTTVVADRIYTVAGQSFESPGITTKVEIFDPETMSWKTGTDLPVPLEWHSTVSVGNNIYVFGGRTPDGPSSAVYEGAINNPPSTHAGPNFSITSEEQSAISICGTASDADNDRLTYRWLKDNIEISQWEGVGYIGEACLNLFDVPFFSIGEHKLTLEVNDGLVTSKDNMILTIDNSAPHAAPTGVGTYELYSPVTLGGQISDFDGEYITYEWLENGSILFSGNQSAIYGGDPVDLPEHVIFDLTLGTHILTLRARDGVNDPVTKDVAVEIIDDTNPTLSPVSNKNILWPPDHKMVDILIETNAIDNSEGYVTLSASISSNEPEDGFGDEDIAPDWSELEIDQDNGVIALQLRAERSGFGEGRVYTITIIALDESGNSSKADVEIIVPHVKGKNK